ncbi:MAG TPA: chemotaxis protein CheW [Polyangiaceae bacterium]|jgi:purine-binding chemotaxis protein CheW|nr:chemotaxis protein CheW [Polyangiaceae bacterium]
MVEKRARKHRHRHDPSKSLVGCIVGDVHYAVPIARVKEIANALEIVALPHAPREIMGVADYRGEVVPVIDLRIRFGLPSADRTRKSKWIVVDVSGRNAALVVDAVTDVFGTGGADLRPTPNLGGGEDRRGIAGVTNYAGSLVFVLETTRLRDLTEPLAAAGSIGPSARPPALPKGTTP